MCKVNVKNFWELALFKAVFGACRMKNKGRESIKINEKNF